MTAAPALELRGLARAFGPVRAVTRGDLTVRAGEVVALLGANGAGKSTLMNMLGGVLRPDEGQIRLAGEPVSFAGPKDAARAGVAFVQQELSVFPTLTVAENVFADAYPTRLGRVDRPAMRTRTRELLETLGADLDPDRVVEGLSTGACQMVEIARAMRREPRVVVFDEPTSSLSAREKARFHDAVGLLRERGVAVVYITHFVGEIFGVCDRAVVMREGETVLDRPLAELRQSEIVEAMLGQVVASGRLGGAGGARGEVVLSVEGLRLPGRVEEASLVLHEGEILGLWGLLGSGRTEIVRALLGLDGAPEGRIALREGRALREVTPDALRRVTAFVTEDRKGEGLLMPMGVARNLALPNLPALSGPLGLVRPGGVRNLARRLTEALSIRAGPGQRVSTLSGGNQQKVVLGKWLASEPRVLILDEPTRGLDLSAKADILALAVDLAARGTAVILVSSEPEELMRVAHRYLVVRERRIVGALGPEATEADLVAALSGDVPARASEAAA